jgi:DNA polymerase (family 10)
VPGFGPAAVQAIHAELGASELDDVKRAASDGRLAAVLGPQRASALIAALPMLRKPVRALRLKSAWQTAHQLIDALGEPERLHLAGQARRGCELVVGGLDLIVAGRSAQTRATFDRLAGLPTVAEIVERTDDRLVVRLYDEVEVRLHATREAAVGAALVWHTGAPGHLERLQARAAERGWRLGPDGLLGGRRVAVATEEAVYAALDLPWIAPELREDGGEIEAAAAGRLPRLIELGDLQGDLHCHTDWTDGTEPLEAMARAAQAHGYAYMALTDHSRALAITNGLSLERLEEARRHVQQLNHTLAPFCILLGTEMDILADGQLDYPDETLASLDYVSASIHSRFKQPEPVMTARILRAIQHPLVHTLNHPHGRLLTSRPAYAVDMPRVIEAAAAAGCALEVSADPARMDLDGGWARQVKAAGGRCTISSDAHSTLDYDNIWLGLGSARRAWLEPADVLNTRPLDELRTLLHRPRVT